MRINVLPYWCVLALLLGGGEMALAQQAGPVLKDYGKVFPISNPDIPESTAGELRAVIDVYDSPADKKTINPQLETAARFLNMHVQAGFKVENLHLALVVHGKASEDLMLPEAYRKKHGLASTNAGLVKELLAAGVEIAICGQSANSRGIAREQLIPGVKWSVSAMTALVHYQNKGYQLIKF